MARGTKERRAGRAGFSSATGMTKASAFRCTEVMWLSRDGKLMGRSSCTCQAAHGSSMGPGSQAEPGQGPQNPPSSSASRPGPCQHSADRAAPPQAGPPSPAPKQDPSQLMVRLHTCYKSG